MNINLIAEKISSFLKFIKTDFISTSKLSCASCPNSKCPNSITISDNAPIHQISLASKKFHLPDQPLDSSSNHVIDTDEFDWETWKGDIPFWKHSVAGSCAGLMEHLFIFPLDTLKTHLQSRKTFTIDVSKKFPAHEIIKNVYLNSGIKGFFRGLNIIALGCVPAHAALFSVFELSKMQLGADNPIKTSICGGLATASHDLILTPTDVIKQRLQLGQHKNAMDCCKTILKNEGVSGFYRSISTTLIMNIPFGAIFVTTNEKLKSLFTDKDNEKARLETFFINAGIAGGISGFLTTPLDVIKTRLQTQQGIKSVNVPHDVKQAFTRSTSQYMMQPKYKTFMYTAQTIFKEEGIKVFWRGSFARLLITAPSTAICWGAYETVKRFII